MFCLRSLSSTRPLLAGTVLALVAVVGCLASPTSVATPQATADLATPGSSAVAGTVASTDGASQTTGTDVVTADAATAVPPTLPPTPRPTARPVPTPIAPGHALDPAATALQTKLSAFRSAVKTQDVSGALRLQRELLSSATDAETAI